MRRSAGPPASSRHLAAFAGWKPAVLAFALALTACASVAAPAQSERWVGAWATAQQIPEQHNALAPTQLTDATLRQTVRVNLGGPRVRVRISNAFGTTPLAVTGVHLARAVAAGDAGIVPGSDTALNFSGQSAFVIPAGAEYVSEAVDLPIAAFDDLAITLHLAAAPAQQTSHPGSRTTSFVAHGAHLSAPDLPGAEKIDHWYFIAGIDVMGPAHATAVAVIGDSITDGRGSTTNGNDRWTDYLARRLQSDVATAHVGVLNFGLGGNRVLNDGLGPNALARFDRDVLGQTGVTHLIIFEGVNDLGTFARDNPDASVAAFEAHARGVIAAFDQMITRAHAHGVRVYGATIAPYASTQVYQTSPASEAARAMINGWIRNSGRYDAVIDFDAVLRDPARPERLAPGYNTGDGLHPSTAGFEAMAEAVPLSLFAR